ncbi:MAG: hypothetical protein ACON4G_04520 [Candidatus Puniceispirillaceae bacterium]
MSWVVILKFFHYLSLFLAGGLGVANGLLAREHVKAATPPAPPVPATMMKLARLGLVSLILIWLTGLGLYQALYQGVDLGWAFSMKLIGATLLLGAVAFLNIHLTQSARAGKPPHPTVMKVTPMVSRGSLILVLAGIAIVTS